MVESYINWHLITRSVCPSRPTSPKQGQIRPQSRLIMMTSIPSISTRTKFFNRLLGGVWICHVMTLSVLPAEAAFTLTVVHTNDVHARFEQFSKFGSDCRPSEAARGACYGGVARRVTALRRLREEHENLLLLDAGDQFQGTLWFFVHRGRAASHFMNLLQYDAMALGNHEFDNGISGVVPFLENVTFPVVSCNIDARYQPEVQGLFQPSVVKTVGGEKIGVIGYTTKDTPDLSHAENLLFEDEVEAVRRQVVELRSQGVNKIIAVGHAGWKTDLAIARQVEGIDLVVGGHTNTFLYTGPPPAHENPIGDYPEVITSPSGSTTLAVQDFAFGKYVGVLHVTFNDEGNVTSWSGNPQLMDNSVEQDTDTVEMMRSWKEPLEASFSKVLGRSHVFLDGARASCRLAECNLGNFVTDSMVTWHLKFPDEAYWANVSMAIHNGGGLRSSISAGNVTLKDAYNVHPFANTIDLVELEGRHIKQVFEHSVWDFDLTTTRGRFLQVSGIRVVYDVSQPNGARVVDLQLRCTNCTIPRYQPAQDDVIYKLAIPSFLVSGGDGYDVIPKNMKRHHVYGDVDIDLLLRHIKAQSPITAGIEGRISFIDAQYCHRPGCGSISALTSKVSHASEISVLLLILGLVFSLCWQH